MGNTGLRLFTIYRSPSDFAGHFVVRPWRASAGAVTPGPIGCVCDTLGDARMQLRAMGLARLARAPGDDPVIVETWV